MATIPTNNSIAKNSSPPEKYEKAKKFGTIRRILPNIVHLKIGTAKNRNPLHVNENRLIVFDFPQGTRICTRNRHLNLGTPTTKNSK
jgi:hypothetical protein